MRLFGQQKLLNNLSRIADDKFPLFSIIVGPKGSEKNVVAVMIAERMKDSVVHCGISIVDVRTTISTSYKVKMPTAYLFEDVDKMSNEAKSALLKITEEPPNRCHFIMTIESIASMPATIVSRAAVFYTDAYTKDELNAYAESVDVDNVVCEFCDTPGDIDVFKTNNPDDFLEYVDLVLDNVAQVGIANSLKIGDKIALKENADGYDLRLFWKAFMYECMQRAEEELPKKVAFDYASGALLTSKYVSELVSVRGVNRNMLFLDWVLEIRREWE